MRTAAASYHRPAPPADRSGFSLIELLVALVISGLLATVVFQSLLGQGRFAGMMSAREEVQQNARAAIDLISSELRGIPISGLAGPLGTNAISFASPTFWGLTCTEAAGGLLVVFPVAVVPQLTSGANVLVGAETGSGTTWASAVARERTTAEVASCNVELDPDPSFVDAQVFRFEGGSLGASPSNRAFVYEQVTYSVGAATGVEGNWILRNGVPVAGPIGAGGLSFRYFDVDGNATTNPAAVVRIEVSVRTVSRSTQGNVSQNQTASTVVFLRNRI